MRLGRERPRKEGVAVVEVQELDASMRLGRERPRKRAAAARVAEAHVGFNEAGARTPQKARRNSLDGAVAHRLQ